MEAFHRAVSYLRRLQAPSGAWTDFWLPVGASDAWVTAFVGLALQTAGGCALLDANTRAAAIAAATAAANWLLAQPRPHGGWGYNGKVAPDADSTAHSLSLLARLGQPAPPEAVAFLAAHRLPGGFRTYRDASAGAWGDTCPDVTAAVLCALYDLGRLSAAELAAEWTDLLAPAQTTDGAWEGYWWLSPAYPTGLLLEVWNAAGQPPLPHTVASLPAAQDAFSLAWTLHARAWLGDATAVRRMAHSLLSLQQPDGGWPAAQILRVPPSKPGARGRNDITASDARRLFVTASALRVLAVHATKLQLPDISYPALYSTAGGADAGGAPAPYAPHTTWTPHEEQPLRRSQLGHVMDRLVEAAACATGFPASTARQARHLFAHLTARSLAQPCPYPSSQLSCLAGGLPLEFSVNAGAAMTPALRCAIELGDPYLPPYRRACSALASLEATVHLLGYSDAYARVVPGIQQLVNADLPVPEATRFWVWGGLDAMLPAGRTSLVPLLKVYLNLLAVELDDGGARRRLEAALQAAAIPLHPAVCAVLDRLDKIGYLHEVGFGLGPDGRIACKLYYELHGWRRPLVGELLQTLSLPAAPDAVVPEIPGILLESLAAKSRAGIALRLDPTDGAARELTIAAAFPPPMLTPQETSRRVAAWIDSLGWDSAPYRNLSGLLLPRWQTADLTSAPVRGHLRMHSLFTRSIAASGSEATIYLRPWASTP